MRTIIDEKPKKQTAKGGNSAKYIPINNDLISAKKIKLAKLISNMLAPGY